MHRDLLPEATDAASPVSLASTTAPAAKKLYQRPRLTTYGDLRGITLGGSPGVGESGTPFNFRPLGANESQ